MPVRSIQEPHAPIRVVRVLQALTVAALGVYAGAMLTEGFVLVPYWRALPPDQFFAWYAANDARLFGFFGPLTILMAALALATAVVGLLARTPGRWWAVLVALLAIVAVAMFPLYFRRVNASFAAATVAPGDLPAELARWGRWHAVRTVLSIVALLLALLDQGASREPRDSRMKPL
jgi:hypothetical protein